jgi:hypothetical protein
MPRSITALVSCLLLILGAARAQISAPNCTDSSMNWVRYLRTLFCLSNNAVYRILLVIFLNIVAQFAPKKSLLGRCIPAGRVQ